MKDMNAELPATPMDCYIKPFVNPRSSTPVPNVGQKRLHPVDQIKVLRVKKFLEENFLQPFTLGSLSREFGLNEFKLKLGFRSLFNTSVFHFAGTLRMEHAGKLIAENGLSIKEVSDMLSYSAPRHFSSAFKKRFGYCPSDLKAA